MNFELGIGQGLNIDAAFGDGNFVGYVTAFVQPGIAEFEKRLCINLAPGVLNIDADVFN